MSSAARQLLADATVFISGTGTEVGKSVATAALLRALRQAGLPVRKADNRALTGIRVTAELLKKGRLVICRGCDASLREFGLYRWDKRAGEDRVVKEHDHAMDDIRYFAMSLEETGKPLAAVCVERRAF